jgi:hypothetical protein
MFKTIAAAAAICHLASVAFATEAASPSAGAVLTGTWTLVAADVIRADGKQEHDYGAAPSGIMMIDREGRYSLQIYKAERPRFAAGDKAAGTDAEFKAAVLGSSTHFGSLSLDQAAGTLTFKIDAASYPNWEGGTLQIRRYELKGDELSYRVPARPNGDVPISIWQRIK